MASGENSPRMEILRFCCEKSPENLQKPLTSLLGFAKAGGEIIPILQMKKLRSAEESCLVRGYREACSEPEPGSFPLASS